jgi:hypothetical protein
MRKTARLVPSGARTPIMMNVDGHADDADRGSGGAGCIRRTCPCQCVCGSLGGSATA